MSSNDLFNKILQSTKTGSESNEPQDSENIQLNESNPFLNLTSEQLEILSKFYSKDKENQKNDANNFKTFLPEQGFCMKTKNSSNQKIFLNICQSNQINSPKDISEQELLKIIEQNDPENAAFQFRVPMSLGEPHDEVDNAGLPCITYDICISNDFFKKIKEIPTFLGFFMTLVIEGLENKYSIKLDRNCKMLKNKKFMGQIKEQHIRIRSKPLIAEMENSNSTQQTLNQQNQSTEKNQKDSKSQIPKYKIIREPQDGDVVEFLVAEIQLPNIISANSVLLDLGEDRILLNTRSGIYHLDIYLPYNINQEECGAQFDKKSKLLTITMPVVN